ncbi:hypothetical protein [Agrobacterium rubi]|uniref:DUF600 family protein n=1 Tax=Agrobacterium rubi TaxID=28099 RepID=A0AAE7RGM2_9HYPH|nr:hypothetical protein [Agrobacterium rubi]NTE89614.1 hypothetical protein [Agrobacterium rubi]NTF05536.1 hypothetical protein [Agrobacterium rubi]NTF39979.1 hypothetical protein [Agrobacterium rubi]OCJ44729.1 hypothetical protein A6U92_15855 [Agrobacterium rubi]QTG03829.1 hypothetical protein G6M88_25615 [Agrobacterium rubi]
MSENSELVEDLVGAIINSDQIERQNWQTFSLVIAFQDERVSETYGYSYDVEGDWEAFSVRPRLVNAEAGSYRDWLKQENDKAVIKMLVQFNRASSKFNVDFEYENPARWSVTPSNLNEITKELHPQL